MTYYVHKKITAFIFVITCACQFYQATAHLQNLDVYKQEVSTYYTSGKYNKKVAKIVDKAWQRLKRRTVNPGDTVIFDIDDTLLSTFFVNKEFGFGNLACDTHRSIRSHFPVIPEVLEFYNKLRHKGYIIILLTGRDKSTSAATEKNLTQAGYTGYKKIIFRNSFTAKNLTNEQNKELIRNKLTEEGFTIIACIGDQKSDVAGDNTGIKVLLPNYMYITP